MNLSFLTTIIEQYGYLGIAFLLAIENIFPPIPSEVVLAFTGFATLKTSLQLLPSIIAATLGSLIGASILYLIGKIFSAEHLEKLLAGSAGKVLRLKPATIGQAADFFNRHGALAVFFGRFVPIIRSLISLPAGMSSYPFGRFLLLSTAGTLIWNTVLILLGRFAGHAWPHFVTIFETYGRLLLIILLIGLLGWLLYRKIKQAVR